MEWFRDLLWKDTVAHTILLYSLIIAAGVFLGKRKILGISLGITFVLFAGIALGHFGFSANHKVVEFVRDFGLNPVRLFHRFAGRTWILFLF